MPVPQASPAQPGASGSKPPKSTPSPATAQPVAGPSNPRPTGASRPPPSPLARPSSGIPMSGISFTNGGGFSFDKNSGMLAKSMRIASGGGGGAPGSYGARFYGGGFDSPSHPFSTSITMDSGSFITSSSAFNLPPPLGSSFRSGRSYAAAARGERDRDASGTIQPNHALSTSFASMSFQPMSMSFGTGSYSKSKVHSLMANRPRTDEELTTGYECCGTTHHGLHELLEHVEDAHPFSDPSDQPMSMAVGSVPLPSGVAMGPTGMQHIGFSPQVLAMEMDLDAVEPPNLGTIEERVSGAGSPRSSMSPSATNAMPSYPVPTSGSGSKPSTPNEPASSPAPLQISDVLTSPFADSILSSSQPKPPPLTGNSNASEASTCSSPPDGSLATPTTSQQPSPVFTVPKVGAARGFLGAVPRPSPQRFDRAFNEVVAGSPKNSLLSDSKDKPTTPTAVAPGVLFASAVAGLGIPTAPPVPGQKIEGGNDAEAKNNEAKLPEPSLFTTHRPWRCPNPGCNKAYKQSNGLKYHQQKGQCDFAIHDAVDLGLSMEEAEERSRPFVCAVGAGCHKRYRQMNGLKYHYLNSGEHGQYGLRMIQNGTHPMPPGSSSSNANSNSAHSTPTASATSTIPSATATPIKRPMPTSAAMAVPRATGAPYTIPSQIGATRPPGMGATGTHAPPRMGVFPPTHRPALGAAGLNSSNITSTINGLNGNANGLAGIGKVGVPVNRAPTTNLAPVQRGRDAVLFAAVDTMEL